MSWKRARRWMKVVGGACAAAALVTPPGTITLVLGIAGATLTSLALDLPRDRWTREERERRRLELGREAVTPPPQTQGKDAKR